MQDGEHRAQHVGQRDHRVAEPQGREGWPVGIGAPRHQKADGEDDRRQDQRRQKEPRHHCATRQASAVDGDRRRRPQGRGRQRHCRAELQAGQDGADVLRRLEDLGVPAQAEAARREAEELALGDGRAGDDGKRGQQEHHRRRDKEDRAEARAEGNPSNHRRAPSSSPPYRGSGSGARPRAGSPTAPPRRASPAS